MSDGKNSSTGSDREWMPVTILLAILLSGLLVLAWTAGGAVILWLANTFPAPANAGTIATWVAVIALGLAVNLAIFFGIFRRADWARWLVALQALVLTVALAVVGSLAVWGILVVAVQTVLVVVGPSNRWFSGAPALPRPRPNTP